MVDSAPDTAEGAQPDIGRRQPRDAWPWAVPGMLTLVVALALIDRRSLWQDELATLSATQRPLPDLVRLVTHSDAVLAPYYALIHVWTALAGSSPTALRLPSALAMAAAVAAGAALTARLLGPLPGLVTGLLLAVCPVTGLYATEARAYAVTTLTAVVTSAAFVRLVRRPTPRAALAYALAATALSWTQVTALSLLAAHALVLAVLPRVWPGRAAGPVLRLIVPAWLLSGLGAAPFLLVGRAQDHQIAWIPDPTPGGVARLPLLVSGRQGLGILLLVLAVAAAAVVLREGRTRGEPTGEPERPPALVTLALAASVALVPVACLALASLLTPVTLPRYLVFTLWGWATLAGGLTTAVWSRRRGRSAAATRMSVPVVVLVAAGALAAPGWAQVVADARTGQPDFRVLAAVLDAHADEGDAIVVPTAKGRRFRVGLKAYASPGHWPRDVLVRRDAVAAQSLDAHECSPATCLGRPERLWAACFGTCTDPLASLAPATRAAIRSAGYRPSGSWRGGNASLTLLLRPDGG